MSNLLIYSMAEFAPITLPILDIVGARKIGEIGLEFGGNTRILSDWAEANGASLTCVDPMPQAEAVEWIAATSHIELQCAMSHDAIPRVTGVDAWFIDGDHNWYTVFHELKLIEARAHADGKPVLAFMHDVGWPAGRRDQYYNPDAIPQEFQQPYSYGTGVTLGNPGKIRGGFFSPNGDFAYADEEGGPRNGVMTALEDFIAQSSSEYIYAVVPLVFGLAVLIERSHPQIERIAQILAPYHDNPLLARVENNRLENYLAVIAAQS
jgi:hypothetical protein